MATKRSNTDTNADKTDKQTYLVCTVINHDGDHYGVGQSIDLTDQQAEALLAVGAVVGNDDSVQEQA